MKFANTLAALFLISQASALAHPQPIPDDLVLERDQFDERTFEEFIDEEAHELYKRKGGGGGGGKGGGSSSSGSSGGSSSGSSGSSGSSSGSRGGSGSTSTGRGSSSSNAGGTTKTGSGPARSFGGGRFYGGGAAAPYTAGQRSPGSKILPLAVGVGVGGALGVAAIAAYPGHWPYGFYNYPTQKPDSDIYLLIRNSHPNSNNTFLDSLIGDGTYANLNQSVVTVADINGTSTIILNGTLPNGTTASGGTEDAITSTSAATLLSSSGYLIMVALKAICWMGVDERMSEIPERKENSEE
ncbi:hypothetical protein M7I_1772 [Glarea lozoyensis 74030]|uniref:DUF7732 domain-containing protein n=1 Tax=Glarea lozoyensis (strain ATCC 74030 / MF5533) TaxID=1104152 RepID=H0EH37_GLAL7|nr:hypothetical protein M7I_1772 [Glarea lozoyensis 74030]